MTMQEQTRKAMRLWSLAQPAVSAFITAVVRDFSERDDVLQDVAVAVLENFESYDESRPFTPWAIGIARNQIGLYLRRKRRNRYTFDTDAIESLAAAFDAISDDETHLMERLRVCVAQLGSRSRRLCELRYRDDLKPAAIATAVSMTANGVSKALQRVRQQLRTCIEGRSMAAR
jgi:RNA polymerase sigma-70 factor (ECF subfamily)